MSKSTDKMNVEIVPMEVADGKYWVKVTLRQYNSFFPSFEDLYRIINKICICEDAKYPNGQGRAMVARFLREACYTNDFQTLKEKYQIPDRENGNAKI